MAQLRSQRPASGGGDAPTPASELTYEDASASVEKWLRITTAVVGASLTLGLYVLTKLPEALTKVLEVREELLEILRAHEVKIAEAARSGPAPLAPTVILASTVQGSDPALTVLTPVPQA